MDSVGAGAAARKQRAAALDSWLIDLFDAAVAGSPAPAGFLAPHPIPTTGRPAEPDRAGEPRVVGLALVATGGLGRRECSPYGDLDLLLLHRGVAVTSIADRIWYPIWDARVALDHSVRTIPQTLSVAIDDVRVALALLDARFIAGDPRLAAELRSAAYDQWRRTASRALVRLRAAVDERVTRHGDLAYPLQGDLKESRGGLRDIQLLRAISVLGITDAYRSPVRAAHRRMLDVRDALHLAFGRRLDRIRAQERDAVATQLEWCDGDALLRRVSADARTIAYAVDDAWRAVDRCRHAPKRTSGRPIARGTLEWLARRPAEASMRSAAPGGYPRQGRGYAFRGRTRLSGMNRRV